MKPDSILDFAQKLTRKFWQENRTTLIFVINNIMFQKQSLKQKVLYEYTATLQNNCYAKIFVIQ